MAEYRPNNLAPATLYPCLVTANPMGRYRRRGTNATAADDGCRRCSCGQQHDNQLNKWGTIAQQKVEAPAEGFGKAERAVDKRRQHDKSGATTTMRIL
jgi:hypothetical protein